MAYRAITEVLLGNAPSAKPGDILPDTYPNMTGTPVPVDVDRLLDIGAIEKVSARAAKAES